MLEKLLEILKFELSENHIGIVDKTFQKTFNNGENTVVVYILTNWYYVNEYNNYKYTINYKSFNDEEKVIIYLKEKFQSELRKDKIKKLLK